MKSLLILCFSLLLFKAQAQSNFSSVAEYQQNQTLVQVRYAIHSSGTSAQYQVQESHKTMQAQLFSNTDFYLGNKLIKAGTYQVLVQELKSNQVLLSLSIEKNIWGNWSMPDQKIELTATSHSLISSARNNCFEFVKPQGKMLLSVAINGQNYVLPLSLTPSV